MEDVKIADVQLPLVINGQHDSNVKSEASVMANGDERAEKTPAAIDINPVVKIKVDNLILSNPYSLPPPPTCLLFRFFRWEVITLACVIVGLVTGRKIPQDDA